MVRLGALIREVEARRTRLTEAQEHGWRDCIDSERESLREIEAVAWEKISEHFQSVCELAGDLDIGDLPVGISLAYSSE